MGLLAGHVVLIVAVGALMTMTVLVHRSRPAARRAALGWMIVQAVVLVATFLQAGGVFLLGDQYAPEALVSSLLYLAASMGLGLVLFDAVERRRARRQRDAGLSAEIRITG